MERPEGNDNARCESGGCYHYLRASTNVVEPEIRDAIIVSAHVELCPIKYSNFEYEEKKPKITEKIIEKIVEITSINVVRVFLTICSNVF